jgi:glycosyltransferase involved in cell wall biosynthesis
MESVLSQTYPNIEFLIIDDGSDDNTLEVIESIKNSHPKGVDMRILSHHSNLGVSETRNHIIDEAQGDYLYFVDSDDMIAPNTISLLMEQIKEKRLDVAFGSYERIEISGEKSLFQYPLSFFEDPDSFAIFVYRKYAGFQASACNYLVSLSLLRHHHLRFFKSDFWEDMVFTLDLATIAQRVVLLPDVTYTYLCRENSLSNSWLNVIEKKQIIQYFDAVNTLKICNENQKQYYPNRCYFALVSDMYIICNVLKKWDNIHPSFSAKELCDNMIHPSTLKDIMSFRQMRIKNLLLYTIGRLPSSMSLFFIRCYGKMKGYL